MGLDMYLKASLYVGGWKHSSAEERKKFQKISKLIGVEAAKGSPSLEIGITVAYWRKANAIHKWFVDNVQEGVDNCEEFSVSREALKKLMDLCERALNGEVNPESSLPTQSGFFFGGTDYGEDYKDDLRSTIAQIKPLLENKKFDDFSFKYQSSW